MKLLVIIVLVGVSYCVLITCMGIYMIGFAWPKYQHKLNKKNYLIKKNVRIDFQGENECAGYSSAYLLRHLGIEVGGKEVYQKMPYKMKDGNVYPKSIPKVLLEYGIKAKYYKGNLIALKNILAKGYPVILLSKRRPDKNWLGYIAVVGYDEKYFYLADSHKDTVNCLDNDYYNCKIEIEVFKKLWNTNDMSKPFYSNTFFALI